MLTRPYSIAIYMKRTIDRKKTHIPGRLSLCEDVHTESAVQQGVTPFKGCRAKMVVCGKW